MREDWKWRLTVWRMDGWMGGEEGEEDKKECEVESGEKRKEKEMGFCVDDEKKKVVKGIIS